MSGLSSIETSQCSAADKIPTLINAPDVSSDPSGCASTTRPCQESEDLLVADPVRVATIEEIIEAKKLNPTRKPNRFVHNIDGTTTIFLERRDGAVIECLIDAEKYDRVKDFRWYAAKNHKTFYATAHVCVSGKKSTIYMHQLLLPGFKELDHKNRSSCDNQVLNLRPASSADNNANKGKQIDNSSGFIGVCWDKTCKKFLARAKKNGKYVHLGCFDNPIPAAKAYDKFIRIHRPEFGVLNFPDQALKTEAA